MRFIACTQHTHRTHSQPWRQSQRKTFHHRSFPFYFAVSIVLLLLVWLIRSTAPPLPSHLDRNMFCMCQSKPPFLLPKNPDIFSFLLWWNGKRVFKRERWQCTKWKRSINHLDFFVVIVRLLAAEMGCEGWGARWKRVYIRVYCVVSMNLLFSVRNNTGPPRCCG